MAVQNAEKNCFRSGQNGPYYQKVIDVPGIFAPVFANKVPALLARKSRGPLKERRNGQRLGVVLIR